MNNLENQNNLVYAGFIKRTAAFVVDYFIIAVCSLVLGGIINSLISVSNVNFKGFEISFFRFIYYSCFALFISIYYLISEVKYQATFGKRLFGLKVVNNKGNKISFISSLFRFLFVVIFAVSIHIPHIFFSTGAMLVNYDYLLIDRANVISYIIALVCFVSYLCLLFSQKKQTLYDKLTNSFVIENKEKPAFITNIEIAEVFSFLFLLLIFILYLSNFVLLYFWEKFIG